MHWGSGGNVQAPHLGEGGSFILSFNHMQASGGRPQKWVWGLFRGLLTSSKTWQLPSTSVEGERRVGLVNKSSQFGTILSPSGLPLLASKPGLQPLAGPSSALCLVQTRCLPSHPQNITFFSSGSCKPGLSKASWCLHKWTICFES